MSEPAPPAPAAPDSTEQHDDTAFASASQSTAEFVNNIAPLQAKKRRSRRNLIILIIAVVLLAAGAGGFWAYNKRNKSQPSSAPQASTQTPPSTANSDTELSEHYVSQDLKLTLDHPKSWEVQDGTSSQLKLESPQIKLTNANNEQVDAKVVISLLSAGSNPPGFTGAAARAVIPSEKIAYTAPTQGQRKETHLTFVSFSAASPTIDAIYITGDSAYQKDQNVPRADVINVVPVIGLNFFQCDAGICDDAISIPPETWQSHTTLQVAQAILKSLIIE